MKLCEKILYCRKRAMLSQEALAERIGVSRQAISKWETGEAMPEVTKLLQLAQTFGVTTDWLLSEDAPQPEPSPRSEPAFSQQPSQDDGGRQTPAEFTHTWVDDVPGMLGRLMRKYGWLFGVRLAVGGAIMLAFGILMSMASNAFINGMSGFGYDGLWYNSSGAITLYDEAGHVVSDIGGYGGDELFGMMGVQSPGFSSAFSAIESTSRNVFGLFSGFTMLLGGVMLIAGIILAVELKKLNRT